MRFYTRYFFKHKCPQFVPAGQIDEEFYTEIKDRLKKEPNFTFKLEIIFGRPINSFYRFPFFLSLFVVCIFHSFFYRQSFSFGLWHIYFYTHCISPARHIFYHFNGLFRNLLFERTKIPF